MESPDFRDHKQRRLNVLQKIYFTFVLVLFRSLKLWGGVFCSKLSFGFLKLVFFALPKKRD